MVEPDEPTVDPRSWARWWNDRGRRELMLVLWAAWDPIGGGVPLDEYSWYCDRLIGLLRKARPEAELEVALAQFSRERIGLEPDPATDAAAADKVWCWYYWAMKELAGWPQRRNLP